MNTDSEFSALQEKVSDLENKIDGLTKELRTNTAATERIEQNTADLIVTFLALQGAFRVLEFLGKLSKPILLISLASGAITAMWYTIKQLFTIKS